MSAAKEALVYDLTRSWPLTKIVARPDTAMVPTSVDSPESLLEWIKALPVRQSVTDSPAPDLREFYVGAHFVTADNETKSRAWKGLVCFVAGTIYAQASSASEIVWRIMPEFEVEPYRPFERADPDGPDYDVATDLRGWRKPESEAVVKCYFRCAFRNDGEAT